MVDKSPFPGFNLGPPPAAPAAAPAVLPQGVAAPAEWRNPALDYLGGLGMSALSGATELVGVTLPGAEEFRRENPKMGFVSQFVSAGVPYVGWMGAARKSKLLMSTVEKIVGLEKSPFYAGAAREALTLLPFEAARVTASQILPWSDQTLNDMTSGAALDIAASMLIGGVAHTVAAAGKRAARVPIPGLDLAAPPPLQLRKLKEMFAAKEPLTIEQQGAAANKIKDLNHIARTEEVKSGKYVATVNNNPALTDLLNSLFKVKEGNKGITQTKMFAAGEKAGFGTEKEWKDAVKWNGLKPGPDDFAETGRYFREITFKQTGHTEEIAAQMRENLEDVLAGRMPRHEFNEKTIRETNADYAAKRAASVDKELRGGMQSLGFGWLMGKEENGMLVLAKKTRGKFGVGKADDRWVLFKTDMPGLYLPKHKAWNDMIIKENSWQVGAAPLEDVGEIYGGMSKYLSWFDRAFHETVATPSAIAALLPKGLTKGSAALVRAVSEGAREYIAPSSAQMRNSAIGRRSLSAAKLGHDLADTRAHEIVFGKRQAGERNFFHEGISEGLIDPNIDSISSITGPLSDEQLEQVKKLINDLVDPANYDELVASGKLSPEARQAADRLETLANVMEIDHQKLAEKLGESVGERPVGNMGLKRYWEGDTRISLADESGKIKIVVGARNKRATQERAKRLLAEDPSLHIAEEIDISKIKAMARKNKVIAVSPEIQSTMEGGGGLQGLRGFKWDHEPVNRKDLLEHWLKSYSAKLHWQATRGSEDLLAQDRKLLQEIDPTSARILEDRLDDLQGKQSAFAQWQNDVADSMLAPMIGPNSASKIVRATNEGLGHWHLGMGNVAQPIMSLLTFMNTVAPEISMIVSASMKDLSGFYSYALAGGTRGPIGPMAFLSPVKILFQSFRAMANPDPMMQKLLARMGATGAIQPRNIEEYIGQNATRVRDLKSAFSSAGGFVTWVKELSRWMPANAERMSRIHAFTVGYLSGKNVMGITDEEQLYQWTKEFIEKTMFSYTTADRPRIWTTPAGSAMGLFKTWMANYMAAMVEYSGQALKGNVAPLFWQTAGTAAVGGIAATPLYWIADGFSKAFTDKGVLQQTYDNMSEGPADALMFGLPAALTNVSLYSQSTSPLSNPERDASMLWSFVLKDRALALSNGLGAAMDHWHATGEHPGNTPIVRDKLFQALAPSTFARTIAAFSGENEIRSLTSGYPIVNNAPMGERFLYMLKLNTPRIDRAMAVADELFSNRDAANAAVSMLGRALAEATARGESDEISAIMDQAAAWALDPSRVLASAMAITKLQAEPLLERTFTPIQLDPMQNVLGQ